MKKPPRLLNVLALAALTLLGSGCERRRFDDPQPPSPPRVPDPSAPRLPEPRTVGVLVVPAVAATGAGQRATQ